MYSSRRWSNPPMQRSGNTVPAQPVVYRGTLFKSKAEARWAAVFDELSVPWKYEPQKFLVADGGYIPDFQLPAHNVWWEVKGAPPTPRAVAAAESVSASSGRGVVLSWGAMGVGGEAALVLGPGRAVHVGLGICEDCSAVTVRPRDPDEAPPDDHNWRLDASELARAFATSRAVAR